MAVADKSFIKDAGLRGVVASFSYMTIPVARSIKMIEGFAKLDDRAIEAKTVCTAEVESAGPAIAGVIPIANNGSANRAIRPKRDNDMRLLPEERDQNIYYRQNNHRNPHRILNFSLLEILVSQDQNDNQDGKLDADPPIIEERPFIRILRM